jgi:hypothetical protein
MTCLQCTHETRDNLRAASIAIYFEISLTLCFLFYWNSWQWWATMDWPWHVLAFCAPFPAAVWLGASAPSLPPRRSALLGVLAGAGGFVLHMLIYGSYQGQLLPPTWRLSLCTFVLAGALLCPSGYAIGCRFPDRQPDSGLGGASASNRGQARSRRQAPYLIYIQTMLGFLGPIIVAIIDRRRH